MRRCVALLGLMVGVAWAIYPLGKCPQFLEGTVQEFSPQPYGDASMIYFANGITFDTRWGEPPIPADLKITGYAPGEAGYYIVQFEGPIYPQDRSNLELAGAEICGYLPNYAYVIRIHTTAIDRIQQLPRVRWFGLYQPAYRLSKELELRTPILDTVVVLLFPMEDLAPLIEKVEALGGAVLETAESRWQKIAKVAITSDKLVPLSRLTGVNWIEPFYEMHLFNANAQWVLQTWRPEDRKIWDKGIRGEGQIVSTLDTGIRTSHEAFRDPNIPITDFGDYPNHRKIIAYQKPAYDREGIITFGDEPFQGFYHGTHTAGSVCGNDEPVGGTNPNDGLAPEARIYFLDGGSARFPGGIIRAVSLAYSLTIPYMGNQAGGARVMSNSWGARGTTAYNVDCAEADQVMWDYPDYLIMFSSGNNPPSPYTGPPAVAKNVVAVGATLNGSAANIPAGYSSGGPAHDGRLKPTIVAPGSLISAYGGSDNGYVLGTGTSMSSPAAAGAAALIRQYFTEGWYPTGSKVPRNAFTPSAALLKAMLINCVEADFTGRPVPNMKVGWGRPNLDKVLHFSGEPRNLKVLDHSIGIRTGDEVVHRVTVKDAAEPLRITLVWTDYPARPFAARALVNDLNLEVVAPNNQVYKGNVFEANESKPGGSFDSLNVEENVFVNAPQPGKWVIKVRGRNVPSGPQPYALVVSGGLGVEEIPALALKGAAVDDGDQLNPDGYLDPEETVKLTVTLENISFVDAQLVKGTLRCARGFITISDSISDYGNIRKQGGRAEGDGFVVSAAPDAPLGEMIDFELVVEVERLQVSTLNFTLPIGLRRLAWVDHDVGNVILTVTQHGSIGFLETGDGKPTGGRGFIYPKEKGRNSLYMASFCAGNHKDYLVDRTFGAKDWRVTTTPDGKVAMTTSRVCDQEGNARFSDAGHPRRKDLAVKQRSFAWRAPEKEDFVILHYTLCNTGTQTISGLYAGVIADFDIGFNPMANQAGTDLGRRLAWMHQTGVNIPHVGIKLLEPGTAANVSVLHNPTYVYNVWHDSTAYKFLSGRISVPSGASPDDWSLVVSAGPFSLGPKATQRVAFAFIGGDDLSDLKSNADAAQEAYDALPEVKLLRHRQIADDAPGNRNGVVEPGETIDLTVALKNIGLDDAKKTRGVLRTTSPHITLIDSVASYGTIHSVDTGSGDTYRFQVEEDAPLGEVRFTLHLTADGYSEDLDLSIRVQGVGVAEEIDDTPLLYQVSGLPTPFSTMLRIDYQIPKKGPIELSIYNLLGAKVRILADGVKEPGNYRVYWDGRDDLGRALPAGVYFYRLKADGFDKVQKVVMVR